jgi:hypothetical protein
MQVEKPMSFALTNHHRDDPGCDHSLAKTRDNREPVHDNPADDLPLRETRIMLSRHH